jgi:hypothetical protein
VALRFPPQSKTALVAVPPRFGSADPPQAPPARPAVTPDARLFPNEASLLRLVTALLAETSEEWESGKTYLNMVCPTQPSV